MTDMCREMDRAGEDTDNEAVGGEIELKSQLATARARIHTVRASSSDTITMSDLRVRPS
jgi:hypothetical protein